MIPSQPSSAFEEVLQDARVPAVCRDLQRILAIRVAELQPWFAEVMDRLYQIEAGFTEIVEQLLMAGAKG